MKSRFREKCTMDPNLATRVKSQTDDIREFKGGIPESEIQGIIIMEVLEAEGIRPVAKSIRSNVPIAQAVLKHCKT